MEFKVGQKVVCINASRWNTEYGLPSIKEGKIYIILGVSTCPNCGNEKVDVGLFNNGAPLYCPCGEYGTPSIWWLNASRFASLEESHAKVEHHYHVVKVNEEILKQVEELEMN